MCKEMQDRIQLLDAADHRKHDLQLTIYAGTEQCSQLYDKDILPGEAETYSPPPKYRIFLINSQPFHNFVTTNINGTNGDRLG